MRYRHRVINPITALTRSISYSPPTHVISDVTTPIPQYMTVERMWDELQPHGSEHLSEHPCSHYKCVAQPQSSAGAFYNDTADGYWSGFKSWENYTAIVDDNYRISVVHNGLDSWLNNCHFDFGVAIDDMIRSKGVQLLDAVASLFELRSAFSGLLPGSSFAQYVAGATLAANFVISPMISDAKFFRGMAKAVADHIAWLRENEGSPVVVRFKRTASFPAFDPSTPPAAQYAALYRGGDCDAVFTGKAVISFNLPDIPDDELYAKVWARNLRYDRGQWGKQLWDAIPFSFVVDWLIRVGDWLARIGDLYRERLPVTVHSCCWSLKRTYGAQLEWWARQDYNPGTKVVICNYRIAEYTRSNALVLTLPQLQLASPGLQQLALALALGRALWGRGSNSPSAVYSWSRKWL